ncbi:hypothetical protein [Qipengyuania citrea]|nr:hypothetical protein [Qipengyuania citrea]
MTTNRKSHTWSALVASYRASQEALNRQSDRSHEAEVALRAARGDEPTRSITYMAKGFTNGPVTLESYERTDTITPSSLRNPNPDYANHPDFLAFAQEVAVWREDWRKEAEAFKDVEADWLAMSDAMWSAWEKLATFAVDNFRELYEKLTICHPKETELSEEEAELLLEHVAQDVARLSGCDLAEAA